METVIHVFKILRTLIEQHSKGKHELFMYGSIINGTMAINGKSDKNSDLDLTIINKDNEDEKGDLRHIKELLEKNQEKECEIKDMKFIQPSFGDLLTFKIIFKDTTIDVDLSFHKILEVLNSKLLRAYCLYDYRFRNLAIVLKAWNKTLGAKKDILNSFSIYLLLLGFMIHNEYLPNLQRLAV